MESREIEIETGTALVTGLTGELRRFCQGHGGDHVLPVFQRGQPTPPGAVQLFKE